MNVRCAGCGGELAPGLLACPVCHQLVHAGELKELAAAARAAEASGDLSTALATWRKVIPLLPPGTQQQKTIEGEMRRLSAVVDGRGPKAPASKGKTGKAVAGAGAAGAFLLKLKAILVLLGANAKLLLLGLVKLPTLISMLVYASWFTALTGGGVGGVWLAVGIVACIYVHEVGHVAALRRYGIDASAPMFIPGFGALVRLRQYPTDAREEARTGLAGPLWGLIAALGAFLVGVVFHSATALVVASWSASINVFNLLPVWQLDGARGLKALSRSQRALLGGVSLLAGLVTAEGVPAVVDLPFVIGHLMPVVVGVVVLARMGSSPPEEGDRGVFWLFVALIVLLPGLTWLAESVRHGAI
jgi:Zn-dependent protease